MYKYVNIHSLYHCLYSFDNILWGSVIIKFSQQVKNPTSIHRINCWVCNYHSYKILKRFFALLKLHLLSHNFIQMEIYYFTMENTNQNNFKTEQKIQNARLQYLSQFVPWSRNWVINLYCCWIEHFKFNKNPSCITTVKFYLSKSQMHVK